MSNMDVRVGYRDANHSNFCTIIPILKADFCITILNVKIPANNNFNTVPDKIKGVLGLHRCTLSLVLK